LQNLVFRFKSYVVNALQVVEQTLNEDYSRQKKKRGNDSQTPVYQGHFCFQLLKINRNQINDAPNCHQQKSNGKKNPTDIELGFSC